MKSRAKLIIACAAVAGLLVAGYLYWARDYVDPARYGPCPSPMAWQGAPMAGKCKLRLNRDLLQQSLQLGTQFLLRHQKPGGNFDYQYNWVEQKQMLGDSQVRQAGALWGLATLYHNRPNPVVKKAVFRGLDFFAKHTEKNQQGAHFIDYPGFGAGRTGTVALCALACIDFLRGGQLQPVERDRVQKQLDGYLSFLLQARRPDKRWYSKYNGSGEPYGDPSPYFDGESLLALTKAAKYLGREELWPLVLESAQAGYRLNVEQALAQDADSKITKGYYQWSSMAFYEIATSGLADTETYGQRVMYLADWMIDVHKTLHRTRNTAYAYEGIIHAYALAQARGDPRRDKYRCVIDFGLLRLTSWQVASPVANSFIRRFPTQDPLAIGGIQNHRCETGLRIDVAQHQMHAVLLAMRYVYQ